VNVDGYLRLTAYAIAGALLGWAAVLAWRNRTRRNHAEWKIRDYQTDPLVGTTEHTTDWRPYKYNWIARQFAGPVYRYARAGAVVAGGIFLAIVMIAMLYMATVWGNGM